jgi:hypothetical protein
MSFMSTIRSLGRAQRGMEQSLRRAAAMARRDGLVSAAILRAGQPPRI